VAVGSRARRRLEQSAGTEPAQAYVPSLRIVGTTWQERGTAYWWRRFWYAVFLLLVVAVIAAAGAAALVGIWQASHGGFWVVLPLALAVVAVTGSLEWWQSTRRSPSGSPAASYRWALPAALVIGLGFLFLPYGGWLVLALASVLLTGPVGAQFLHACVDRELWPERERRMSGLSPAERRRAEKEKGWLPARFRSTDRPDQPKTGSEVHPHE
jgi:hypothetical protein